MDDYQIWYLSDVIPDCILRDKYYWVMASKCCNADLVPVLISSTPEKLDSSVGFTSRGTTHIEQYCRKCGKLNRTDTTPDWVDEICKEAIR